MITTKQTRIAGSPLHLAGILFTAVTGTFLLSCGERGEEAASSPVIVEDPAVAAIFLDSEPAAAIPVREAREKAKPGEEVVVEGKIAGTMHPFTEGFATLVLADLALETCDLIPGDECPTPWDACCAAPEEIKASRITLQVTDPEGRPVGQGLEGLRGLKELDAIVVKGTVSGDSNEENMIIELTGLYQKEG